MKLFLLKYIAMSHLINYLILSNYFFFFVDQINCFAILSKLNKSIGAIKFKGN